MQKDIKGVQVEKEVKLKLFANNILYLKTLKTVQNKF